MDSYQRRAIQSNQVLLLTDMHAEDMLPFLSCLISSDRDRIAHQLSGKEKNYLLLQILQVRDGSWDQLLHALHVQKQDYLAKLLSASYGALKVDTRKSQPLEELRQRLITFYLSQFSSYQSLFPGSREHVTDLYVSGCWLNLSDILKESRKQPFITETIKEFYDGNSESLSTIPCQQFSNCNDIIHLIQSQAKKVQQAIITGDAGVGKTTFVRKLCHDWAEQALKVASEASEHQLSKYTFVFAVPLRTVEEDRTLPEIVLHYLAMCGICEYTEDLLSMVEAYCKKEHKSVLFLLDGLDECKIKNLSGPQQPGTLGKLLDEESFPEMVPGIIIVTTRPNSAKRVTKAEMHFKLLGLAEKNSLKYVDTFFRNANREESIRSTLTALKRHPHLRTTPLLLMLTCHLVKSDIVIPTGHRNDIYDKICLMLCKNAHDSKRFRFTNLYDWKGLEVIKGLMHLAFHGELKGKLFFSLKDLTDSKVNHSQARLLGLLREDFFFTLYGSERELAEELSFPHKSIQEYFAAEYVRLLSAGENAADNNLLFQFHNKFNTNSLIYAVEQNLVQYLRSVAHKYSEEDIINAVMRAAQASSTECMEVLLEDRSRIDAVDKDGWTALMHAASGNHVEIVGLLLKKGAHIEKANNDGRTALMLANSKNHIETVQLLHEYDAKKVTFDKSPES